MMSTTLFIGSFLSPKGRKKPIAKNERQELVKLLTIYELRHFRGYPLPHLLPL